MGGASSSSSSSSPSPSDGGKGAMGNLFPLSHGVMTQKKRIQLCVCVYYVLDAIGVIPHDQYVHVLMIASAAVIIILCRCALLPIS